MDEITQKSSFGREESKIKPGTIMNTNTNSKIKLENITTEESENYKAKRFKHLYPIETNKNNNIPSDKLFFKIKSSKNECSDNREIIENNLKIDNKLNNSVMNYFQKLKVQNYLKNFLNQRLLIIIRKELKKKKVSTCFYHTLLIMK